MQLGPGRWCPWYPCGAAGQCLPCLLAAVSGVGKTHALPPRSENWGEGQVPPFPPQSVHPWMWCQEAKAITLRSVVNRSQRFRRTEKAFPADNLATVILRAKVVELSLCSSVAYLGAHCTLAAHSPHLSRGCRTPAISVCFISAFFCAFFPFFGGGLEKLETAL